MRLSWSTHRRNCARGSQLRLGKIISTCHVTGDVTGDAQQNSFFFNRFLCASSGHIGTCSTSHIILNSTTYSTFCCFVSRRVDSPRPPVFSFEHCHLVIFVSCQTPDLRVFSRLTARQLLSPFHYLSRHQNYAASLIASPPSSAFESIPS